MSLFSGITEVARLLQILIVAGIDSIPYSAGIGVGPETQSGFYPSLPGSAQVRKNSRKEISETSHKAGTNVSGSLEWGWDGMGCPGAGGPNEGIDLPPQIASPSSLSLSLSLSLSQSLFIFSGLEGRGNFHGRRGELENSIPLKGERVREERFIRAQSLATLSKVRENKVHGLHLR